MTQLLSYIERMDNAARGGQYRAAITCVYRRDDEGSKLVVHQQTPLSTT